MAKLNNISASIYEKFKNLISISKVREEIDRKLFSRDRVFTFETLIHSFIFKAERGFQCGDKKAISLLFANRFFDKKVKEPPTKQGYNKAIDKIPFEAVNKLSKELYNMEYKDNKELYRGMRIIIPDGTLCNLPRTDETIEKIGLGSGSQGDAYYPQARIVGFYDLSTGLFESLEWKHYKTSERSFLLDHAKENQTHTLYIADAGYTGMAVCAIVKFMHGQDLLIHANEQSKLIKKFRKSRKRSEVFNIKITNVHLQNYPEYKHLKDKTITIRLIRTKGTTKLKSMILITTLLDEKEFKWQELSKLYLQRYKVELAFRHLKKNIKIEKINKVKFNRIMQLFYAGGLLFNLSVVLRNVVKKPSIMPEPSGTKVYCLELCTEFVEKIISFVKLDKNQFEIVLEQYILAIKSCYSISRRWRVYPRICQTSASVFTRQKLSRKNSELKKVEFMRTEYKILQNKYAIL